MTNNTIPNVPRELLAELQEHIDCHRDAVLWGKVCDLLSTTSPTDHVEGLRAMVADPSPAGVDGLEVATFLHTLHMELGQTEQFCSKWKGDPFGVSGVDYSSTYSVTSEPLCRLSDAQAIIDGLRGENERIRLNIAEYNEAIACYQSERDQQAQRIGELEQILRDLVPGCKWRIMRPRIDAALSAGKDSD